MSFGIILFIFFIAIIIFTLFGNVFVLILSLLARKLPTPVNCCYVSLAVADILVAAFAMTSKVVDFGLHFTTVLGDAHLNAAHSHEDIAEWSNKNIVCDVHHFLRVFACTASILHVCIVAIERCRSLDKPFGYMSPSSYKATIIELIIVWTTSFLASALSAIWMYQLHEETGVISSHSTGSVDDDDDHVSSSSIMLGSLMELTANINKNNNNKKTAIATIALVNETHHDDDNDHDEINNIFKESVVEGDCVYPSSAFYLIGSSLICYYIPLTIMFAFYGKIYILARRQLDSLKEAGERDGGRKMMPSKSPSGNWHYLSFRIHRGGGGGRHNNNNNNKEDGNNNTEKSGAKAEASDNNSSPTTSPRPVLKSSNNNTTSDITSSPPGGSNGNICGNNNNKPAITPVVGVSQEVDTGDELEQQQQPPQRRSRQSRGSLIRHQAAQSTRRVSIVPQVKKNRYPTIERLVTSFTPLGRAELFKKWQYYVNENKAVRTLGMLLGVFVSCWSPYFALNLVFALVGRQNVPHSDILFDGFIWLGFLNSAFNPLLYALSAKEYKQGVSSLLRNIGLCRHPSSTSTASTLSSRLNPSRFGSSRAYDNTSYLRRRRDDLQRTILALQGDDGQGSKSMLVNLQSNGGDSRPYRKSIAACSLEANFPTSTRPSDISWENGHMLIDLSDINSRQFVNCLTPDEIDAFFGLMPTSTSLQQIELTSSRWARFFSSFRSRGLSMPKMAIVCKKTSISASSAGAATVYSNTGETALVGRNSNNNRQQIRSVGDTTDDVDYLSYKSMAINAPNATIASSEDLSYQLPPSSMTMPSSAVQVHEEAQNVLERLKVDNNSPCKVSSNRRAASYYRQRKTPRGNRFVKNSRSNPRLVPVPSNSNNNLTVQQQQGVENESRNNDDFSLVPDEDNALKTSPSTSSQLDGAPRLAKMLIQNAISNSVAQFGDNEQQQQQQQQQQRLSDQNCDDTTVSSMTADRKSSGGHQMLRFTKSLLPMLSPHNWGLSGGGGTKDHHKSTIGLTSASSAHQQRQHQPLCISKSSAAALASGGGDQPPSYQNNQWQQQQRLQLDKSPSAQLLPPRYSMVPEPPPSAPAIKFLATANEFFILAPSLVGENNGKIYPAISIADFNNPSQHEPISTKLSDPRRRSG